MKTLTKVMIILLIASCIFMCLPQNMVFADKSDITTVTDSMKGDTSTAKNYTSGIQKTINTVIGFLQIASGMAAIISLVMVGFNYITAGTAVKKEDVLGKFWPILIGFILVFGASTIVKFAIGVA